MKIEICDTAGLCFGASRAIQIVLKNLKGKKQVCIYKPLLHNENVMTRLKSMGAKVLDDLNQINCSDYVILRAHGEEKFVYDYLSDNNIEFFDCICPNVKRVRDLALRKQNEGFSIIVLGNYKNGKLHDETISLLSYLNNPIVISKTSDLKTLVFDKNKKYYLVSQTTFPKKDFITITNGLQKLFAKQNISFDFCDTICKVPIMNIKKSIELAKRSDIVVVYGSKTSSNTTELYNNIKNFAYTIFSLNTKEILLDIKKFLESSNKSIDDINIALVAGASTFKEDLISVKQVIEKSFNKQSV